MSSTDIQLYPPVFDADDVDAIWLYYIPQHVPRSQLRINAERDEAPDASRLAVLKAHDAVMHELRRLAGVASFNLTEPNAPTHPQPRCCETHRSRNDEDKCRIKHTYYTSKLLKVRRGMEHRTCDEEVLHTKDNRAPCMCQHCILFRYRTGRLRTRRSAQQLSMWDAGLTCYCAYCKDWFTNNPHHPILRSFLADLIRSIAIVSEREG